MAISDLTGTTWKLNETINVTGFPWINGQPIANINFNCGNSSYTKIMQYSLPPQEPSVYQLIYFDGNDNIAYAYSTQTGSGSWSDQTHRLISITGGTDVTDPDLIAWLEANATQQGGSQLTVDMSTLTGWASLSAGTHTLTIVAKATGYIDSDPSTGVQFMKGQRVDAPYIELGE